MNESTIFGMSARGVLALIITISCCAVAVFTKDLGVLKDLAFLVLGFYFGQKPSQSITGVPNATITTGNTTITSKSDINGGPTANIG